MKKTIFSCNMFPVGYNFLILGKKSTFSEYYNFETYLLKQKLLYLIISYTSFFQVH